MRLILIIIFGLLLTNCNKPYVKNKNSIKSSNDLMKFTNLWCEKNKFSERIVKMCGQGWSKDLNISEKKAIMDAKLKIADISQHLIVKSEKISHSENNYGVEKDYEMIAENKLENATVSGYRIISKKVLREKNGWRTMVLLELKNS